MKERGRFRISVWRTDCARTSATAWDCQTDVDRDIPDNQLTKGLTAMRIDESCVFHIVTIETESRRRLCQMEQAIGIVAVLVTDVAAVASEIEGSVAAPLF